MKSLSMLTILLITLGACSSSTTQKENTEVEVLQNEIEDEKRELEKVENMIDNDKKQLDSMKKELEKMGLP